MAVVSRSDVEVVVVGEGAVAAAVAWHLAREGREVLILPQSGTGRGEPAAPVAVRPEELASAAPVVASVRWWRQVEAETGAALLSLTDGVDHGAPLRTAALARRLTEANVPHVWLRPDEAERRWPGMAFGGPVLHQPGNAGRLRPAQAARALRAAAVGWGAVVEPAVRVRSVAVDGDDRVRLRTSAGPVRARRLVVAAGAASAGLLPYLPVPSPRVISSCVAGFTPLGINPCIPLENNWPIFADRRRAAAVAGVPDPCGQVVVALEDAGDQPAALRCLLDYVTERLPGLDSTAPSELERARVETADGRPVLASFGPVALGYGFSDRAIPAAPAIGRELADLALGARQPA